MEVHQFSLETYFSYLCPFFVFSYSFDGNIMESFECINMKLWQYKVLIIFLRWQSMKQVHPVELDICTRIYWVCWYSKFSFFWPKRSNISYASAHISGCTEWNHFLLCHFKQMVSTLSCYSFMLIGPSQLIFSIT